MLPDFERPDRIGEFYGNPKTRPFAELLIDCEDTGRSGSRALRRPTAQRWEPTRSHIPPETTLTCWPVFTDMRFFRLQSRLTTLRIRASSGKKLVRDGEGVRRWPAQIRINTASG